MTSPIPAPPEGTPTGKSRVYRDITSIPDVYRNYAAEETEETGRQHNAA